MSERSPGMKLIDHLLHEQFSCVGRSKIRFDHNVQEVIILAIRAGLRFDIDDFTYTFGRGWGAWCIGGMVGERAYTIAAKYRNTLACKAYEQYKGRKPFILDGARLCDDVGIRYDGRWWYVTSFKDKTSQIVLCSYSDYYDPSGDNGFYHNGRYWWVTSKTNAHPYTITAAECPAPSRKPERILKLTNKEFNDLRRAGKLSLE